MPPLRDLTGQRFGKLTVLERGPTSLSGRVQWWCGCDCGTQRLILACSLRCRHTTSCGCQRGRRRWDGQHVGIWGVTSPLRRFAFKVWARGDCWEWRGARQRKGYGLFQLGRQYVLAHRFAYTEAKGPLSYGQQLDHLCHHPWCVRPSHLEVVTGQENIRRGRRVQGKKLREYELARSNN